MSEILTIRLNPAGGDYRDFVCPFCHDTALFEIDNGAGHCDHCGAEFLDTIDFDDDGEEIELGDQETLEILGPGWCWLECRRIPF